VQPDPYQPPEFYSQHGKMDMEEAALEWMLNEPSRPEHPSAEQTENRHVLPFLLTGGITTVVVALLQIGGLLGLLLPGLIGVALLIVAAARYWLGIESRRRLLTIFVLGMLPVVGALGCGLLFAWRVDQQDRAAYQEEVHAAEWEDAQRARRRRSTLHG